MRANIRSLLFLQFIVTSQCQISVAKRFLDDYNRTATRWNYRLRNAEFQKRSNLSEYNTRIAYELILKAGKLFEEFQQNASNINLGNSNADVKRQFKLMLTSDISKDKSVNENLYRIKSKLQTNYGLNTISNDRSIIKSNHSRQLGITQLNLIFETSNDPNELFYAWKEWRDGFENKSKSSYIEYIRLKNIAALENGFEDAGEYKRKLYEVDDLEKMAEDLWHDLKPFYNEIHAYVRYKLSSVYPDHVNLTEPLPAHLLGNMWAQDWSNVFKYVKPFPDESSLSLTPILKKKFNVTSMFKIAEKFFVSLDWPKLPSIFWEKSMLQQPKDRPVLCHPSAWDLSRIENNEKDTRMLMCTQITEEDFKVIHHELGHIYYYNFYWEQPVTYRHGANPGFHEAVGDSIILSVQTPKHLQQIGLLENISNTEAADINFLMKSALDSIAFLPFGYLVDKWVWGVYSGDIKPEEYNTKWWEMRLKYQGIKPPVERSENDFDPAAKFHVSFDVPYIRYFFAIILKYTFHKHACEAAGNKDPLYKCSIYKSKKAGDLLKNMLALGKSQPWPQTLEVLTGSKKMTVQATNEYFRPLIQWLKEERIKKNYPIGWPTNELNDDTNSSSYNPNSLALLLTFAIFIVSLLLQVDLIFSGSFL